MPTIQKTITPSNRPANFNAWAMQVLNPERINQINSSIGMRHKLSSIINEKLRFSRIKNYYLITYK